MWQSTAQAHVPDTEAVASQVLAEPKGSRNQLTSSMKLKVIAVSGPRCVTIVGRAGGLHSQTFERN